MSTMRSVVVLLGGSGLATMTLAASCAGTVIGAGAACAICGASGRKTVTEPGGIAKPSSTARLTSAVSCTSERRLVRATSAGGLERGLPMIIRLPDKALRDPTPQSHNFLRGFSLRRELGHAQPCPERILVVVTLPNEGERKQAERVERRGSFAQPATPCGRLVEDEGKPAIEPANSDQRRYCGFDI